MITFDEFKKLDIRIGKIIKVEKVEAADVDGKPVLLHPEAEVPAGSVVK